MARRSSDGTFGFLANVCFALAILSVLVSGVFVAVIVANQGNAIARGTATLPAVAFFGASLQMFFSGLLFKGMAEIVQSLRSIEKSSSETARRLTEFAIKS